ncbi:aminomethyl-transferring glycine dehydrogenase subunit GcvPA [Polymorphobacter fuscus]|uniref:Probable glycine dehydrogenase (decarboxylating) subunit 1 n=1 Tax=Sandarakinorhabdus fusca TaxID=1439888 RepID=A0A7C9GNK5_9SPHN|nr:aminomethyl-transferring glycine dehydrogenase subunit GcvPA [Polymorphobacter fuscus]KAB7648516.1 aminomethyl-transferring glycine dehydrogenase subunit GcvPA [Polymorphobacter fuscus]MQT16050.1 aminomethyl-transferring glycine dehydrogenase subunit GcvPA [Polymorphobacter fuscus]NJC07672.1 glycine dehydrogenase subunit 1 [Polymorphobacter fuscus]
MRYLPLTQPDREAMLAVIGAADIDALFIDVPQSARLTAPIAALPLHAPEQTVERALGAMAAKNMTAGTVPFFVGGGAYKHHVPASVDHIIQRGEFLTAYTPYQPEIAQGTLQVLFEFQTQVARLLGMDVANASMYDGSTAMTEAVFMARRVTRRAKALVSAGVHPHYVNVLKTLTQFTDDVVEVGEPALQSGKPGDDIDALMAGIDAETSCVVVQNPNVFGHVADLAPLAQACHAAGALLVVVVTEVVSLGAMMSPGEMGADIVVGEGQSIGNGLNFGGPYLGLFATRDKYVRQMPGRLCGETVDADGKRGFVLTLSTREQHIRREKATSNICTNSGLCALAFSVHMTLLGEKGLRHLASLNHAHAVQLAERLGRIPGVELVTTTFFNEFTLKLPVEARPVVRKLADRGVLGGISLGRLYPGVAALDRGMLVAVTETATDADFDAFEDALDEVLA